MINRRGLITGLISLVAAPAIIRLGLLMPVKVIEPVRLFTIADYERMLNEIMNDRIKEFQDKIANQILYGTDNVHYFGGLVYFVKDRKVRVLTNTEIFK